VDKARAGIHNMTVWSIPALLCFIQSVALLTLLVSVLIINALFSLLTVLRLTICVRHVSE
jgi:hypothetical protein